MGRKGKDKAVFDLPKAFTSHLNLDEALLIIALAFRRKATEVENLGGGNGGLVASLCGIYYA